MAKHVTRQVCRTLLATSLMLLQTAKAQGTVSSQSVTEVTSLATVSGSTITEIFTPTSVSISGITPPITAAITTTTTDASGQTIAIAVAAGAGVVAGGGLAAWLFKPVPGAPPAPTEPPPYSTQTPDVTSTSTTSSSTSASSSSLILSCPYPTSGYPLTFASADTQPQWTALLPPAATITAFSPQCTAQGSNNQLLRGADPGYINALAQVFCKKDLSEDQSATLGQSDLPNDSKYKNAQLDSIRGVFDFQHKITNNGCAQNCVDAYSQMNTKCQYNSHVIYGAASLEQGCGSYALTIDADPITTLTCNPNNPVDQAYDYRDAAVDAINDFCTARDGESVKQGDSSTDINELTFSVTYASNCVGSGTYAVSKDTCISYLMQTLDDCDTTSTTYKHGGTLIDKDNCGSFSFHPTGSDKMVCYPQNQNEGYISGQHVAITPNTAEDAISQFCDRSGNGQSYTLDPNNIPSANDFVQDPCTTPGYASCTYFYYNNGTRASASNTGDGPVNLGDVAINLSAKFAFNDQLSCSTNILYEIHGDRCHSELGKLIGIEPAGNCIGSDPNALDLGSFIENADKGCVFWNFWAVATH